MGERERLALEAFAVALALAFVLTPVAARAASALGIVDRPGGRRAHTRTIPFGGGVAMLVAILVPALWLIPVIGDQMRAILVGAALCTLLGLIDDRFVLSPAIKLACQCGIAMIPVSADVVIDHLTLPVIDPIDLGWVGAVLTVVWIVALMNMLNFIDGMDGLAAGIAAISSGSFAILALSLNRGAVAILAAAMAGACIGFLRHNFHPARVFMGDAGSLMLGFLLATISIQGVLKTAAAVAVMFPLIVLLVPILDTSFVVLKRLKYGRRPWEPDRNHLHHRFATVGWSQRRAALLLYAWCGVLAVFALTVRFVHYRTPDGVQVGATLLLASMALVALLATVYIVYVLEILKQRHLQLFGLGRSSELPGSTPLVVARRARRDARRADVAERRVAARR